MNASAGARSNVSWAGIRGIVRAREVDRVAKPQLASSENRMNFIFFKAKKHKTNEKCEAKWKHNVRVYGVGALA